MFCTPWKSRFYRISSQVGRKPSVIKKGYRTNHPAPWQSCILISSPKQSSSLLPPTPLLLCTVPVGSSLGSPRHLVQDPYTQSSPLSAPGVRGAQPTSGTTNAPAPKALGVPGAVGQPWATLQQSQPRVGGRTGCPRGRPPIPTSKGAGWGGFRKQKQSKCQGGGSHPGSCPSWCHACVVQSLV